MKTISTKKRSNLIIAMFLFIAIALYSLSVMLNNTKSASALTENMTWKQRGDKSYQNSYVYVKFDGTVSYTPYIFSDDRAYWNGESYAYWAGTSPWNADSITLNDTIWVSGIGSASFSAGYPSGVAVSVTTGSKEATYSYTVSNSYDKKCKYSYSSRIGFCTYVGQKESAYFKFGSAFVVVDSEANQTSEFKSSHWFS